MKTYEIYVDYHYGPCEVFTIDAKDLRSAKKKAKEKYAKTYFRKSDIKTALAI